MRFQLTVVVVWWDALATLTGFRRCNDHRAIAPAPRTGLVPKFPRPLKVRVLSAALTR